MVRPTTPSSVEGLPMTTAQKSRLDGLIKDISAVNPGRAAAANLAQAISSWRLTVRPERGKWIDVPYFRLQGGRGPAVKAPWVSQ